MFDCVNSIRKIQSENNLINKSLLISDVKFSFLNSIICIGALVSNLGINSFNGSLKSKILYNNVFYIAGNILIIMMTNFYTVLIGRFLIGLAIGVTCSIVPLYLNLLSPDRVKGLICCLHGFGIVLGILIGQILAYLFTSIDNWKYAYYGNLIFLFIHTFFLSAIKNAEKRETYRNDESVLHLLKNRKAWKSLSIAVLVHLTQQTSCINGVIFYSSTILEKTSNPRLYSIYVGGMSLLSTTISMFVIDKFGRKFMLLSSFLISIIGLVLLSYELNPVLSLFIYIVGFNIGLGPVVWMLTGEIFPEKSAKAGSIIAVSVNWISNFLITMVFPSVLKSLGPKSFLIYAFSVLVAGIYIYAVFKETKGKSNDFQ
ncbi:hypothetical protein GVAV_002169 [Gurleya vavrai]